MSGKFAKTTDVSVEKSKAEIEATVRRYGADGFMSGWADERATIQFRCQNRHVRFVITLPARGEARFTERGYSMVDRTPSAATDLWEQACRQKWRALALLVKAKLESVEAKIETFDSVFLSNIVLPDGNTVGDAVIPKVESAYKTGSMPLLLGGPSNG